MIISLTYQLDHIHLDLGQLTCFVWVRHCPTCVSSRTRARAKDTGTELQAKVRKLRTLRNAGCYISRNIPHYAIVEIGCGVHRISCGVDRISCGATPRLRLCSPQPISTVT